MVPRLARRTRPRATAQSVSITAPIGGLNARDSLAAMPPTDAITLDNFFCTPTTVDLRRGYTAWCTGFPAQVESLMPYISGTATKIFAAAGTAFYDATSSGAVGAAVQSGLSNARWVSINFATPGGQFLYAVNGVDKPRYYDGASWVAVDGASTPAITGVTTTLLTNVNSFKGRLYFIERDSMSVWYLPLNSVGGAAQELDLGPIFKLGGKLQAMGTWTVDNAAGIQEFAVFLSSEGEIAVYQGYDPSTAGSWSLVGLFRVGRPIGKKCFCKMGSDLIVLSTDGFFPLSKALLTDRYQLQDALSNKIVNLVHQDVQSYSDNFGWEAVLHPFGTKFIVNVPVQENQTARQYVMNTISSAWSRFTEWNANCFAVVQDELFFGGSTYTAKADTGFSDNGAYIPGEVKTAFQNFGAPGMLKRWTMVRPIFNTAGNMGPAMRLDIDFENVSPTQTATYSPAAGTPWNTALWNTFPWAAGSSIRKDWQGANGIGYWAAFHMRVVNNTTSVQWMSIDYVFERGGIL